MTTVLYWTVCIVGASTLSLGVLALIDLIERPRKNSRVGGITRAR